MLLGRVDSGKSVLTYLIAGGGGRRNDSCREVDIKLNPDEPGIRVRLFEPAVVDINKVCLDTVREQTGDTCFVVVVDITKSVEFANELVGLKELSEYLSDWSYSLFGNSMIVLLTLMSFPLKLTETVWWKESSRRSYLSWTTGVCSLIALMGPRRAEVGHWSKSYNSPNLL